MQQEQKLDEAEAIVCRTDLIFVLQCLVAVSLLYHGIALCLYVSCHCNARLTEDLKVVKNCMQAKADSIGQCMDLLFSPPKKDDAMPHAHEDMCSAKGSGKGRPLRVPELGEEDGPKWIYAGWLYGWKLWVGDLPNSIEYCDGQAAVAAQPH